MNIEKFEPILIKHQENNDLILNKQQENFMMLLKLKTQIFPLF